jgi:hypothetical protein
VLKDAIEAGDAELVGRLAKEVVQLVMCRLGGEIWCA